MSHLCRSTNFSSVCSTKPVTITGKGFHSHLDTVEPRRPAGVTVAQEVIVCVRWPLWFLRQRVGEGVCAFLTPEAFPDDWPANPLSHLECRRPVQGSPAGGSADADRGGGVGSIALWEL